MSKTHRYLSRVVLMLLSFLCFLGVNMTNAATVYEPEVAQNIVCEEIDIIEEPVADVAETVVVAEVTTTETIKYFNVPLSRDLQDRIFSICEKRNIDPALIIAMIQKESTFNPNAMGDNGHSHGLMQIQPRWHQARMNKVGCTNLLDPYQNVAVGIDYIAELLGKGKSVEWALMAYNGGPSYANKKAAKGEVSEYAKIVLNICDGLSRG